MSLTPEQLELYHTQAENPARYGGEVVVRADDMLELLDAYQRQSTYQPTRPLTAVAIALDEIERREAAEKRVAELEAENRDLREQIAEITTGEKGGAE